MKKFTFLLLLVSFTMQAKFYTATVHFTDGTSRSGFAEAPGHKDSTLKFRASKDGDTEKIESSLISTVDITFDKKTETFFCVYPAVQTKKGPKKESKKRWFGSVYQGKTNFLYISLEGNIATSTPGMYYYLHTPGEDYTISFLFELYGNQKVVGEEKMYKRMIEAHFPDRCPVLVEKSKSGAFKTKDINEVIAFFKENCE
ncbi:hypothetical protein [Flavobacterium sp.]|uniref:hypothetical protein n=1 Tax=Flavobacterium sp. TaxID=239 RepID=UPI00403327D6